MTAADKPVTLEELEATWHLVDDATGRLLATASALSDADCRGASLLPGWTRGHVLTHVARNADALSRLLTAVRTGEPAQMYPNAQARDAEIEDGSGRPAADQVTDLRTSAARLQEAAEALGDSAGWRTVQEWRRGRRRPASDIPRARLAEVELHHVDTGTGYSLADVPAPAADALVDEALARVSALTESQPFVVHVEGGGPVRAVGDAPAGGPDLPVVSGTRAALVGWLTGRTDGSDVTVEGVRPELPPWS